MYPPLTCLEDDIWWSIIGVNQAHRQRPQRFSVISTHVRACNPHCMFSYGDVSRFQTDAKQSFCFLCSIIFSLSCQTVRPSHYIICTHPLLHRCWWHHWKVQYCVINVCYSQLLSERSSSPDTSPHCNTQSHHRLNQNSFAFSHHNSYSVPFPPLLICWCIGLSSQHAPFPITTQHQPNYPIIFLAGPRTNSAGTRLAHGLYLWLTAD